MLLGSGGDSSSLYALLAVVADPKSAKANLDELKSMSSDIQKQLDDQAETKKLLEAKEKANKEVSDQIYLDMQGIKDREDKLTDLSNKLDARQYALDQTASDLEQLKKDWNTKVSVLDQRQTDLSMREGALKASQDQLQDAQAKVDSLRYEYETKLKQLKGLIDGSN